MQDAQACLHLQARRLPDRGIAAGHTGTYSLSDWRVSPEARGVDLHEDRDLAWKNFAGWRVNYDSVLRALAEMTMAPQNDWLSAYTFVRADPESGETGGGIEKVD